MNTKQSVLYIDDTGKVGEGTYAAVDMAIATDSQIERVTVEEPCRGETWVAESPGDLKASTNVELKFKLGSTVLQLFVAAAISGDPIGILDNTGDRTVTGHQGLVYNALVKNLGMPKPAGDYVKYTATLAPHAANDNASLPQILTAA